VDSTTGGTVTEPGEGTFAYSEGAVVDLLAVPDEDFIFLEWTGNVGTVADVNAADTTITMNGDYSITANFSQGILTAELWADWNILSTPVSLAPEMDTWVEMKAFGDGLAIAEIDGVEVPAYYFDGSVQQFGEVADSYVLRPCDAIYVKMAEADTLTVIPSSGFSAPTKTLYQKWNLISLSNLVEMAVQEALVSIYEVPGGLTGYTQVVSPNLNQDAWVYTRDAASWWSGGPMMVPTEGAWAFMENGPDTLAGFVFTPTND
ncbi:hypothetical protein ACFLVN_05795, partial [Chloroflexota bacterium]